MSPRHAWEPSVADQHGSNDLHLTIRQALGWIGRLTSGSVTAGDVESCQPWQKLSPAHAAAFQQAASLDRLMGDALPRTDCRMP